jgi:hypothetical protein
MFTKGKKSPAKHEDQTDVHPQNAVEPPEPVFVKAGKRKHPGKVQGGVRKSGGPVGTIGQSASGQAVPGGKSTKSSVSSRKGVM